MPHNAVNTTDRITRGLVSAKKSPAPAGRVVVGKAVVVIGAILPSRSREGLGEGRSSESAAFCGTPLP
ncbi:hypothetical protein GCM10011395_15600 [Sphingomonas psychrolutea]|uniref:Uncharacterized protein n=1 Tax=Sphingomonas psychrolutea TaxID=1259676 RepID=A0ABQ1GLV5_9SPHN|nr:hypothetical protein GCM10011395_15600 [Sphingomonas psychrolutea]